MKIFACSSGVIVGLLLPSLGALAQEQPPAAPDKIESEPQPQAEAPPVWRQALTHYELGESELALELLKAEVHRCAAEDDACSSEQEGTLYACVGIVQAGGSGAHEKGVVAFRKALSLDPQIVLLPEYRTAEVLAAYNEAKTGQAKAAPVASTVPLASTAPPSDQADKAASEEELARRRQREEDLLKKRGILLVTGVAQYGSATLALDGGYSFENISADVGHFAGSVIVAGMPGETSGFTMGARGFGGVIVSERNSYGHFGFSGLLGSTVGKRRDDQFSYFLAEIGMDNFPAARSPAMVLGFHGGASLGGFALGGNLGMTAGSDIFLFMLGVEIGYGRLL